MEVEIACYHATCSSSSCLKVRRVMVTEEMFKRKTSAVSDDLIVWECEKVPELGFQSELVFFVNKIEEKLTKSYRSRLEKGLKSLERWKKNEEKRHSAEVRRIENEIKKGRKALNG